MSLGILLLVVLSELAPFCALTAYLLIWVTQTVARRAWLATWRLPDVDY